CACAGLDSRSSPSVAVRGRALCQLSYSPVPVRTFLTPERRAAFKVSALDDPLLQPRTPEVHHLEDVVAVRDGLRPRRRFDGSQELLLVPEPPLRESVEADVDCTRSTDVHGDRADDVVLHVAVDVEALEDRAV